MDIAVRLSIEGAQLSALNDQGSVWTQAMLVAPVSRPRDDPATTGWRVHVRAAVLQAIAEFLDTRCTPALEQSGVGTADDVLRSLLAGGKGLRSTFLYLGYRCGAGENDAAVRAAASLEFLHAFALMQDDVMDCSPFRRGRPAAHYALANWHRRRGLPGSPTRFGESAAVLLADLCLVWAEQMLRESGLDAAALARAWPRYDAMRTELAVGQFADLVNHASGFPTLDDVLAVARSKSGNYTVRRPLEIGATLAGCDDRVLAALGDYGEAVGEAFQLRDDLLGVFGAPASTGKPAGGDLADRKATTVVVAAYQLATTEQRRELSMLMSAAHLAAPDIARWQTLIAVTGAVGWIEQLIEERFTRALDSLETVAMDSDARAALAAMAAACTERST